MSNPLTVEFFPEIVGADFRASVPRWNYSHASTPTWRFYWNPAAGAWIFSKGKKIELTPDRVVIIPPRTPFSTGAVNPFPHLYAHFILPDECAPLRREVTSLDAEALMPPGLPDKLPHLSPAKLKSAVSALIHTAFVFLPEDYLIYRRVPEEPGIFEKAVKILESTPSYAGSCEELARACGTTVNTLHRQFFKAAGLPVKTWLLNRKMENAAKMLLHEGLSIKETADRLGYSDRYHFSKTFKKFFGTSPASFVKSGGIPLP